MWLRSSRAVKDGRFRRDPHPDMGKLVHRPVEGLAVRADRLRKEVRQKYRFYSVWVAVAFPVLVLTREISLLVLLVLPIGWLLGTYGTSLKIQRDCPMVEIYEKGVKDRVLYWPWEYSYFWPFHEMREMVVKDGYIILKPGGIPGSLAIDLREIGPRGYELIQAGRNSPAGTAAMGGPPELRLYTAEGHVPGEWRGPQM